ncbi:MAG: hypothetical protein ACPGED_04145 [Flavobacteriales bacterium]
MKQIFLYLSLLTLILVGCKKEAGEGGQATIKGKISKEVRLVITNPSTLQTTYPAPDQEVFIVYGENTSPDDRIHTNFDGEFEFKFLREGNYTIYTYSKDTTGNVSVDPNRMAIVQKIEISDRKQTIDAGTMTVYDTN